MFLLFSEEKLHFSHIILIISKLPLILPIIFVSNWQISNCTCATGRTDKCNNQVALVYHSGAQVQPDNSIR